MSTPKPPAGRNPGGPPAGRGHGADAADAERAQPATTPHSYGQAAELPDAGEPEIAGEVRGPRRPIARHGRVEDEHDSLEDLADEPIDDGGDGESSAQYGRTRGEHLEPDVDSDTLAALGDAPLGAEDDDDGY